jgi:hypothetical protein
LKTRWRYKYNDPEFCAAVRADERDDCIHYLKCLREVAKKKYGKAVPCKECEEYEKAERGEINPYINRKDPAV